MANKKKKSAVPAPEPVAAPVPAPVEPEPAPSKLDGGAKLLFWAILIFAIVVRLGALDKASYMIDEINVIRDAMTAKSLSAIWETELGRFTQYHRLPMLMGIIRVSVQQLGDPKLPFPSEWSTRAPIALIGIASVVFFYFLGRTLRGVRLGLWLMFLAAFNTFHVYYSREAYDYIMLVCFATGTMWTGVNLLRIWDAEKRIDRRGAIFYVICSTALLHAHLSGLLFLGCWSALLFAYLCVDKASRAIIKGPRGLAWLALLGAAFVTFLPFLIRVFGFTATEDPRARRISFDIIPSLLGRMGWGEAWYMMIPFIAVIAAGGYYLVRGRDSTSRIVRLLVIQGVAYFFIQTWSLKVSRFEVRYFAALLPVLLLFAAGGLDFASRRIGSKMKFLAGAWPDLLLGAPIAAWMALNAWQVMNLECRGQNYKGLARWVNENLPKNGIYSFWNGYEVRGVPTVYQTPERFGTFPAYWSSDEDYRSQQIRERLTSFFMRFPLAAYIELYPDDLLHPPTAHNEPVPRDRLFANKIWLEDPAYERLVAWQTLPLGHAQWLTEKMDHILVSYNKVEDLPSLTAKQGRYVYHYFGEDWQYAKDQQMNDWLVSSSYGTFFLGNIKPEPVLVSVKLDMMSPPSGCEVSVYSAAGGKILDHAPVPGSFKELQIPPFVLAPGKTQFSVEVLPTTNNVQPQLLIYGLKVEPAG